MIVQNKDMVKIKTVVIILKILANFIVHRNLLLMTFIYISISLKTSNIENKLQVLERSNCTITE